MQKKKEEPKLQTNQRLSIRSLSNKVIRMIFPEVEKIDILKIEQTRDSNPEVLGSSPVSVKLSSFQIFSKLDGESSLRHAGSHVIIECYFVHGARPMYTLDSLSSAATLWTRRQKP